MSRKEIILSFSDWTEAIKQARILIYFSGIVCGLLAFFWLLSKPVSFNAEGAFKGNAGQGPSKLVEALSFLGGGESYTTAEDPRSFLRSYPVMKEVVLKLNLQAALSEKKFGQRFGQMWNTFQTEKTYLRLKKHTPHSLVAHKAVAVPTALAIPDRLPSFVCSSVYFNGEIAKALSIVFQDQSHFFVKEGKKWIGEGSIDTPFIWKEGSFTLSGKGKKGKKAAVTFIPLEQSIRALQNSLQVLKTKECSEVFTISFAHTNRHLAAEIVNETMRQFERYLQSEGKKKISKQLEYLEERRQETLLRLETVMDSHKAILESYLSAGEMLNLENEIEFMAETQGKKRESLSQIASEMVSLTSTPFFVLLDDMKKKPSAVTDKTVSVKSVRTSILDYQQKLDLLRLQDEKYDFWLEELAKANFNSSSLLKSLEDPSLSEHFKKIHTIDLRLLDPKNWTAKEKEQMEGELQIEKKFILQHIERLKEGLALDAKAVQARLDSLKEDLLFLLHESYVETEKSLKDLALQAARFPEKWVTEQKMEINTRLNSEIMESVAKLIEAKNINYNLDYLMAGILKAAKPPVLPDRPHLFLGSFAGCVAGILAILLFLCFREVWLGPSACYENLKCQNRFLAKGEEAIKQLGYALLKKGKVIVLASQTAPSISTELKEWFEKRGEELTVIKYSPGIESRIKEKCRVLIVYEGSPNSVELCYLCGVADAVIYGIHSQRAHELESLPEETLFYFEEPKRKALNLKEIGPLLTSLLLSFRHDRSDVRK